MEKKKKNHFIIYIYNILVFFSREYSKFTEIAPSFHLMFTLMNFNLDKRIDVKREDLLEKNCLRS